jgi:hypothetical protein
MKSEPMYDVNTYHILKTIYEFMCDGRIYLAREQLATLLNIQEKES